MESIKETTIKVNGKDKIGTEYEFITDHQFTGIIKELDMAKTVCIVYVDQSNYPRLLLRQSINEDQNIIAALAATSFAVLDFLENIIKKAKQIRYDTFTI